MRVPGRQGGDDRMECSTYLLTAPFAHVAPETLAGPRSAWHRHTHTHTQRQAHRPQVVPESLNRSQRSFQRLLLRRPYEFQEFTWSGLVPPRHRHGPFAVITGPAFPTIRSYFKGGLHTKSSAISYLGPILRETPSSFARFQAQQAQRSSVR